MILKVLQAAPVGSRAVFDFGYGVKTVLHKINADTWQHGKTDRYFPGFNVSATALVTGHEGRTYSLRTHPPAPVRVTQWRVGRTPWFTRYCRVCGDFDMFENDGNAAHDDARSHAREHAQERVA